MNDNNEIDTKVTVEGCKTKVTREEASSILAGTAQLTEGPERESAVDKWHYAHLTK